MKQSNHIDEDITLIDTIQKISDRISYSGSKQDIAHSQFLLEMVEDMEAQVHYRRQQRTVFSRA